MAKMGSFGKMKKKIDHSRVFSCLHHFFIMCPCLFLPYHLFCLSHRKTRRTMSMDNVGLEIYIV
jgi:hypothetical protein